MASIKLDERVLHFESSGTEFVRNTAKSIIYFERKCVDIVPVIERLTIELRRKVSNGDSCSDCIADYLFDVLEEKIVSSLLESGREDFTPEELASHTLQMAYACLLYVESKEYKEFHPFLMSRFEKYDLN